MTSTQRAIRTACTCALLCAPFFLAACGGGSGAGDSSATNSSTQGAVIPASIFLAERPANSSMLREVKANSKVGDKVVFEARVGGRSEPFVDGMAIFLTADPRLVSCDQRPGDNCPAPYDYCCENSDAIKAGTATIQILDPAGTIYPVSVQGQGGIEPLKTLVIEGVVSEKDADGVFVVDASKVWVGSIPKSPPSPDEKG